MLRIRIAAATVALPLMLAGCDDPTAGPLLPTEAATAKSVAQTGGPYTFSTPVFDIAAMPNGSILVAEGNVIKEISRNGVREVTTIPTIQGEGPIGVPAVTPINGLEAIGTGSFFATRGGVDKAVGAALFHGSSGGARLVADIAAFETQHNPDAMKGLRWKNLQCEAAQGFSPGPQSNPYHLTAISGSEVLIGDAAGNSVLWAKMNREIDWVALPTPPTADGSGSTNPADWLVWNTLEDGTDCYVQPVPTSVAVGPDGAYYVSELTGLTAAGLPIGLSRVWRIEPGARNVICPSASCRVALSGLTSVIDLAFGPDGMLYVLEYDENSWLAPFINAVAGGTINRCDISTTPGTCSVAAGRLTLPGAITFDKWGDLWVVENNLSAPTVRRVELR